MDSCAKPTSHDQRDRSVSVVLAPSALCCGAFHVSCRNHVSLCIHTQRGLYERGLKPFWIKRSSVCFFKTRTLFQQSCRLVAAPASQLAVLQIQSRSRWMMGTRKTFAHPRVAIISHIGIAWTMVLTAICPFCRIDLRDLLKVRPEIQCRSAKVLQILKGVVQMQCT